MISFFVRGQALKISQPLVVSDTIDYLEAAFVFQTSDWDGLSKWAHFTQGEKVYDVLLTDDKIRREDHLNLSAGEWTVHLHATSAEGMRITTEEMKLTVKKTGMLKGQPLPEVPVSAAEQIAAQAQRADNTAKEALTEASKTGPFAETAKRAAEAASESARASDISARASGSAASSASVSASAAEDFAKKAEQAASNNGYVSFEVDESGNLIFTKTTNVTFGDFRMEEGDLILYG